MANETTTTTSNDVYIAADLAVEILDEERPQNVCRPFFHTVNAGIGSGHSSAMDFAIQADPGAATSGYTEGTGISNTALSTDKVTATATSNGQQATVTLELRENSIIDIDAHTVRVLGRSVAERFETDATALLDDFANTTGTAGVATTYATFLEGKNQLLQRDQTGTMVAVLDPSQTGNMEIDLGTSGAAALASGQVNVGDVLASELAGFQWTLAGVPVFATSLVTSTGGAIFVSDVALALYEIRPPFYDSIKVPNIPAMQHDMTSRYGMVERRDRAGETLISA